GGWARCRVRRNCIFNHRLLTAEPSSFSIAAPARSASIQFFPTHSELSYNCIPRRHVRLHPVTPTRASTVCICVAVPRRRLSQLLQGAPSDFPVVQREVCSSHLHRNGHHRR